MSSWKGLIITLCVFGMLIGALVAAVYWPRTDQVEEWGKACLDLHKDDLRDPQSAYIIRSQLYESDDIKRSVITVSALNGFGGRVQVVYKCDVRDGRVR
jgi:Na+-translocating ferredoxin:NAD+ oxidoreductase RnfG subunit